MHIRITGKWDQKLDPKKTWVWVLGLDPNPNPKPKFYTFWYRNQKKNKKKNFLVTKICGSKKFKKNS